MNNYNDGVLTIYKSLGTLNTFSGKVNETLVSDLEYVMDVYFHEESRRQEDITFSNSMDKTLNMKVKVPYTNKILSSYKAVYNNYLYDIIYIDFSKDKKQLYLYLEEVREFGI